MSSDPAFALMLPEWIVVFERRTTVWWGRFLRDGYGHCWAMAFDVKAEAWVMVNPLFEGTLCRVMPDTGVRNQFQRAREGEVKMVSVPFQAQRVVRPRLLVTCAGCVASVLGLRRYPLTPWGLLWTVRRIPGVREYRDGQWITWSAERDHERTRPGMERVGMGGHAAVAGGGTGGPGQGRGGGPLAP